MRKVLAMAKISERKPGAQAGPSSWRDVLPIHPATELFPRMSSDELRTLADDIKKNSLQTPIAVRCQRNGDTGEWSHQLLDGISRLDAIELAGFNPIEPARSKGRAERGRSGMDCGLIPYLGLPEQLEIAIKYISPEDPLAYVISANIHRRHLAAEQKRELIAALLKAAPEKSDHRSPRSSRQARLSLEKCGARRRPPATCPPWTREPTRRVAGSRRRRSAPPPARLRASTK